MPDLCVDKIGHATEEFYKGESMMTLQEKLDVQKKHFVANVPAETVSLMERSTQELLQSGILGRVLKPGDSLPPFCLPDEKGETVSSEQMVARGPLVVTIYRGVW